MNSRYDFMSESSVVDDEDNDSYPDILSVDYSNYGLSEVPVLKLVSSADIQKFWTYMNKAYGISYYDDILLNMNGIGYIGMLEPGSKLVNFSLSDIKNFNTNKRKESN